MKINKTVKKISQDGFRYRGLKGSRLETLTDTIVGFSITLLVISSEVPTTYVELQASMYSFVGFVFCTLLLLSIWNSHKIYFLRYGLQDSSTNMLNFMLLFVLLFYIYPMKYLFSYLGTVIYANIKLFFGDDSEGFRLAMGKLRNSKLDIEQWSDIMLRFGFGLFLIYLIFMLLYMNAVRKKKELKLNRKETYISKTSVQEYGILLGITFLSIIIILIFGGAGYAYSWMIYLLIPILLPLHASLRKKRYRNISKKRKGKEKKPKTKPIEKVSEKLITEEFWEKYLDDNEVKECD